MRRHANRPIRPRHRPITPCRSLRYRHHQCTLRGLLIRRRHSLDRHRPHGILPFHLPAEFLLRNLPAPGGRYRPPQGYRLTMCSHLWTHETKVVSGVKRFARIFTRPVFLPMRLVEYGETFQ